MLHTWDIDVALDPTSTIARATQADVVVDNLAMIIGWAGKSDGNEREIVIKTTDPSRTFVAEGRASGCRWSPRRSRLPPTSSCRRRRSSGSSTVVSIPTTPRPESTARCSISSGVMFPGF